MGKVVAFTELHSYLNDLEKQSHVKGTILDTNVLISATYDVRDSHEDVVAVWETLQNRGYGLFATVNTRAEYLEFHRRLILTENILDLVDDNSALRIPKSARAKIQTLKGSLRTSVSADSERDEVFNESQLKKIKKEFSAGPHSGQKGWLELCDLFLKNQLEVVDNALGERGIEYISFNQDHHTEFFKVQPQWTHAIKLCEKAGTPFNDSMILNALKSSNLNFIVTLDFDVGYAALSDPNVKDVVVPDRLYRELRQYHFPS